MHLVGMAEDSVATKKEGKPITYQCKAIHCPSFSVTMNTSTRHLKSKMAARRQTILSLLGAWIKLHNTIYTSETLLHTHTQRNFRWERVLGQYVNKGYSIPTIQAYQIIAQFAVCSLSLTGSTVLVCMASVDAWTHPTSHQHYKYILTYCSGVYNLYLMKL